MKSIVSRGVNFCLRLDESGDVYVKLLRPRGVWSLGYLHPSGYRHMVRKGKSFKIHRLVAKAFMVRGYEMAKGDEFVEYHVDHINGIKTDNRPSNLQWLEQKAHNQKTLAGVNERIRRGETTRVDGLRVRETTSQGWVVEHRTRADAARVYGVHPSRIPLSKDTMGKLFRGSTFEYIAMPDLDGESWKIFSRDGRDLKVSNHGRLCNRHGVKWLGSPCEGYRVVRFANKGYKVHRLVASLFLAERKCIEPLEVDHINGVKHDNRACNLRWVTRLEHMQFKTSRPSAWLLKQTET